VISHILFYRLLAADDVLDKLIEVELFHVS
jgi:hypothetical protein